MNFVKGMFIGSAIAVGATMLYMETTSKSDKKKLMKQGKKFIKNMKIM